MKKFLSFMVVALVMVFPLVAKADVSINNSDIVCTPENADKEKTCTIKARFDDIDTSSLEFTLTEEGGAEIKSVDQIQNSYWSPNATKVGNAWNVKLTLNAPGQVGEFELFSVTYKASGLKGCGIKVKLGDVERTITSDPEPKQETPKGICKEDKANKKYYIDGVEVTESQYKEQCVKTGSTLPYLALGAIVVLASAAYVATKNKTKMYKI